MATTPVRRIRLDTLTGVRGLLSITIFLNHCAMEPVFQNRSINHSMINLLVGFGEAAVSFFFMLSGFVLVWVAPAKDTAGRFWRRRFFKIFPNHATTWLTGLVLMLLAGELTDLWSLLPSLFLVHVWIPVENVIQGTNGPAWSLACEVFSYALFPLLLPRINRIAEDRLWRAIGVVVLVMVSATVLIGVFVPPGPNALGEDVALNWFYLMIFFPPVRLLDFVLGMLVARVIIARRFPDTISWWVIGGLMVLGWAAGLAVPRPLGFIAPMVLANILLLGKAASTDLSGRATFLTSQPLQFLGNQSYARYLVHWEVLHFGRVFLGGGPWPTPVAITFLAGAFVVTLALSELLRRFVELPSYRRWARPPRPAPARAPILAPAEPVT